MGERYVNVNIAFDLGSWNTRMCVKERGLVMNQSSAWAARAGQMTALGDEAFEFYGRAPEGLDVAFAVKGGAIAREDALTSYLSYLFEKAIASGFVHRPRVLIARAPSLPMGQMKRLVALALDSGANACTLVRLDLAAALGAGIDIALPKGQMVIDVGAHSVNGALIVMNTVAFSDYLPFGMAMIDDQIVRMMATRYGCHIGPRTAEGLKISLATAIAGADLKETVTGLDGASGFPRAIEVEVARIVESIEPLIEQVALMADRMLRAAGHELTSDLMDCGIVLTGGGAQVYGLSQKITEYTGIPCRVAELPQLAVARGLSVMLEKSDEFDRLGEAHQTILEKRLPGVRR